MSVIAVVAFLLAPVTDPEILRQLNAPPPCKNGAAECEPWERDWPEQKPNPFDRFDPPPERLGPGPHTLVISDGNAMTRIDYRSGAACQRARDKVRLQTDARLTNRNPNIIYGPPKVTAFCVPR